MLISSKRLEEKKRKPSIKERNSAFTGGIQNKNGLKVKQDQQCKQRQRFGNKSKRCKQNYLKQTESQL